jgi:hypothetical protein
MEDLAQKQRGSDVNAVSCPNLGEMKLKINVHELEPGADCVLGFGLAADCRCSMCI